MSHNLVTGTWFDLELIEAVICISSSIPGMSSKISCKISKSFKTLRFNHVSNPLKVGMALLPFDFHHGEFYVAPLGRKCDAVGIRCHGQQLTNFSSHFQISCPSESHNWNS